MTNKLFASAHDDPDEEIDDLVDEDPDEDKDEVIDELEEIHDDSHGDEVEDAPVVLCPECTAEIEDKIVSGKVITCPGCDSRLEVQSVNPTVLVLFEEVEVTVDSDDPGAKKRQKQTQSVEPVKRVTGTKSVSHGVVPSADPKAPFGRDENDKAIVPERTDHAIVSGLLQRPDLQPGKCKHKNDPSNCLLCGTKPIKPRIKPPDQSSGRSRELRRDVLTPEQLQAEHLAALEENARRMFKTPKSPKSLVRSAHSEAFNNLFEETKKSVVVPTVKHFDDLTILEIKDIHEEIGLNKIVPPAIPDVPKQVKAKSTLKIGSYRELLMMDREHVASLFDLIVEYVPSHPVKPTEEMIQKLQTEIAELDASILTRSSAYQKRHRPNDSLEKNDRERLKREETRERAKKKKDLNAMRAALRNYVVTPVTFGEKYNISHQRVISTDIKFVKDKLRTPAGQEQYYTEPLMIIERVEGPDAEYNIGGYREFLNLGVEALAQITDGMSNQGWVEYENKVILKAIECGLIKPNVEVVKQYPGLDVYQRPLDSIESDYTHEASLIIKTGGAQIGGNVRGGGYTGVSNNTRRKLTSFDSPMQRKGPEHQHDRHGVSEDDEGHTPD